MKKQAFQSLHRRRRISLSPANLMVDAMAKGARDEPLGRARAEVPSENGCVFYDFHRDQPTLLDIFAAPVKDGRGRTLHRRLFAVETMLDGSMQLHEPTIVLDVIPAPVGAAGPNESVESETRGFDLISRKPHPEDPAIFIEVRFIEVKGRAGVGVVAVSENEYRTAERLKNDYWLYTVFNCASSPELHIVQNPARLGWQPIMAVEHYQISPDAIRCAEE